MTVGRSQAKTHQLGAAAEEAALAFMLEHGYDLVATNYHSVYGEIDFIVSCHDELVFVEVKARSLTHASPSAVFGHTFDAITARKQQKMAKTAAFFLAEHVAYQQHHCRFDAIAVSLEPTLKTSVNSTAAVQIRHIEWIKHAFENVVE